MRRVIILILCTMVLCFIGACSQNDLNDNVIFKKVNTASIQDSDLQETISGNLEDGVYAIQTELKYYIFFNGTKNSYKNFSCKVSKNSLEIFFNKEPDLVGGQIVYEVDLPESVDTIELLQDDENIAFKSVILADY